MPSSMTVASKFYCGVSMDLKMIQALVGFVADAGTSLTPK